MNCRTHEHRHFERTLRSPDTVPGPLLAEGRVLHEDCSVSRRARACPGNAGARWTRDATSPRPRGGGAASRTARAAHRKNPHAKRPPPADGGGPGARLRDVMRFPSRRRAPAKARSRNCGPRSVRARAESAIDASEERDGRRSRAFPRRGSLTTRPSERERHDRRRSPKPAKRRTLRNCDLRAGETTRRI